MVGFEVLVHDMADPGVPLGAVAGPGVAVDCSGVAR